MTKPVYIFEGDAGLAVVNDLSLLYYTFATFVVSALKLRCSNKKTWIFLYVAYTEQQQPRMPYFITKYVWN